MSLDFALFFRAISSQQQPGTGQRRPCRIFRRTSNVVHFFFSSASTCATAVAFVSPSTQCRASWERHRGTLAATEGPHACPPVPSPPTPKNQSDDVILGAGPQVTWRASAETAKSFQVGISCLLILFFLSCRKILFLSFFSTGKSRVQGEFREGKNFSLPA